MVSRDNGDNGPSPNGFWLTKGKDGDSDDDNVDDVDDGDNDGDGEQWDNGDNGGAQNQMGLATSERNDVGSQSFMAITIIPPTGLPALPLQNFEQCWVSLEWKSKTICTYQMITPAHPNRNSFRSW